MISIFISAMLLLSPAERDSLLTEIPLNADFWEEVFNQNSGDTLTYCEHIFLTIPKEDREGMTALILEDHILSAMNARNTWYEFLPDMGGNLSDKWYSFFEDVNGNDGYDEGIDQQILCLDLLLRKRIYF